MQQQQDQLQIQQNPLQQPLLLYQTQSSQLDLQLELSQQTQQPIMKVSQYRLLVSKLYKQIKYNGQLYRIINTCFPDADINFIFINILGAVIIGIVVGTVVLEGSMEWSMAERNCFNYDNRNLWVLYIAEIIFALTFLLLLTLAVIILKSKNKSDMHLGLTILSLGFLFCAIFIAHAINTHQIVSRFIVSFSILALVVLDLIPALTGSAFSLLTNYRTGIFIHLMVLTLKLTNNYLSADQLFFIFIGLTAFGAIKFVCCMFIIAKNVFIRKWNFLCPENVLLGYYCIQALLTMFFCAIWISQDVFGVSMKFTCQFVILLVVILYFYGKKFKIPIILAVYQAQPTSIINFDNCILVQKSLNWCKVVKIQQLQKYLSINIPQSQQNNKQQISKCIICFENGAVMAWVPCGHLTACAACWNKYYVNNWRYCILCKQKSIAVCYLELVVVTQRKLLSDSPSQKQKPQQNDMFRKNTNDPNLTTKNDNKFQSHNQSQLENILLKYQNHRVYRIKKQMFS